MDYETIRQLVEKNNINWIQTHFTDLFGRLRVLHIPSDRFFNDDILNNGSGFDGSSVGFTDIEKSDLIAIPDPKTFIVLPHEKNEGRIIADIHDTSLQPLPIDPRYILKQAVNSAQNQGFDVIKIAPEMEFFVLSRIDKNDYDVKDNDSYFFPPPLDDSKEYRKNISNFLLEAGYDIKYHHHETGRFQHEIEINSLNAIEAADFCIFFKFLSREIANRESLQVTFIPKLFPQESGNGMHVHICLYKNGKNVFHDENDTYNLSQTAYYFIGGIIEHAKGLAAITNPTVNSYKRLVPNFEAPVYIAWARYNRSSLLRIAAQKNVDIEIRNGDSAANPYLFFAALIYSGLDGIKHKIQYQPVEKNIYSMSQDELRNYGINKLPSNLFEAIEEFENDTVLQQVLGKSLSELYIEKKKEEFNKYMTEITNLDRQYYFNC
jgi:glutamine synthetase